MDDVEKARARAHYERELANLKATAMHPHITDRALRAFWVYAERERELDRAIGIICSNAEVRFNMAPISMLRNANLRVLLEVTRR